jgi:hypothetical protein
MYKNTNMNGNFHNLQKYTNFIICNINDMEERYLYDIDNNISKVSFFIGNKKVDFRNIVLKICYDEDEPIDNTDINKRINRFLNKMRNNIKVSLSI